MPPGVGYPPTVPDTSQPAPADSQAASAPVDMAGMPQGLETDDRTLLSAVLGSVSDKIAGRPTRSFSTADVMPESALPELADPFAGLGQQGDASSFLPPLPGDVDNGEGFTNLPGARTGDSAEREVEGIISEGGPGAQLVEIAKRALGTEYVWGGASWDGMDCSGLVLLAAREMGIDMPRVSRDQARAGVAVDGLGNARAGDLVAFDAGGPDGVVNHIGIFVGYDDEGRPMMLHAPRTGKRVEIVPITRTDIMAVRRITGGS